MGTPFGPGPLVYAHRGASAHAPDNSIQAFELAVEHGADGIELDVRRSLDGHLILAHDPAHPAIGPFAAATLEDIKSAVPEVATLKEGMASIPRSVYVNVEIKNHRMDPGFDRSRGIVDQALDELDEYDDISRILISSFDPLSTRRAKRVRPDVATGQLVTGRTLLTVALRWANRHRYQTVNVHHSLVEVDPERVVADARARDLAVAVWTVDEPSVMKTLFEAGVAAVMTNNPAVGRTVIDSDVSG
jgi:glycerophosphoryl diester phosphodiesterase